MILKNNYLIGTQIQFYEIEMLEEHLKSCANMLHDIENLDNVTFKFLINLQQHYERIDWKKFYNDYLNEPLPYWVNEYDEISYLTIGETAFRDIFIKMIHNKIPSQCKLIIDVITTKSKFYNIADFRRDLAWNGCMTHDFVMFGETDSLWPKQTLEVMEGLHSAVSDQFPKFVANFAGRKNWDSSWDQITHPLFQKVQYQDNDDWIFNNEASEKSYMSLERMNEINDIDMSKVEIHSLTEPKADGSCLIWSSELLRSGVTLPKSLIHHGEDESMLRMAKRVMGDNFVQFHIHNLLRVHNRRHPKKRMYILNENNPTGICTPEKKGFWWAELEDKSKFNLETLFYQRKSKTI